VYCSIWLIHSSSSLFLHPVVFFMPLDAVLSIVPVVQYDLHQRVPEMLAIKQIVVLVPLA
jgi:hypothetical protein